MAKYLVITNRWTCENMDEFHDCYTPDYDMIMSSTGIDSPESVQMYDYDYIDKFKRENSYSIIKSEEVMIRENYILTVVKSFDKIIVYERLQYVMN